VAEAQTLVSGEKKLASTNKAEQLTETSTVLTAVSVKAKKGNAAVVNIGPSTLNAEAYELEGGESLEFNFLDPSRVYVYGKQNDIVKFIGLVP
jgi:hypothetical protein